MATVVMERGLKATLLASTITLSEGGDTVTYTPSAGFFTTLNDGSEHFLVLDFTNEGGGNIWRLRTSIDGDAFVDQGTGTGTGPDAANIVDTDPNVAMDDVASDAFMDEVVMWVNHTQFTSQELQNLNDLGDVFAEPMTQYSENFGAPICWQATATVGGRPWSDSGPGACPAVVRIPKGASDVVVTDDGQQVRPRIIEG